MTWATIIGYLEKAKIPIEFLFMAFMASVMVKMFLMMVKWDKQMTEHSGTFKLVNHRLDEHDDRFDNLEDFVYRDKMRKE